MSSRNLIEFKNVYKDFDTAKGINHVLRGINLNIPAGSIYGIIGYSGAGKSTLIRCINGLETPTKGKVIYHQQAVNELNRQQLLQLRSKISMIFQQFNLMPERTIAENIALPIKYHHVPKAKRVQRVKKLLKIVGLPDKFSAYPSSLSGGQKQRVAIARALINNPQVLLCDEATSALDPDTTEDVLKLLHRLNHDYGITIVVVTHEMKVIETLCDQVAVLDQGKIIEHGNVYDIFANPQTSLTKKFVQTESHLNLPHGFVKKLHLQANQKLLHLKYRNQKAASPTISKLSRQFGVNFNVITGDMQIIQNKLLGDLICVVDGKPHDLAAAIKSLKQQDGIQVEVISYD